MGTFMPTSFVTKASAVSLVVSASSAAWIDFRMVAYSPTFASRA
jgi:hypothetical protein